MAVFTVRIETDNDAFSTDADAEVARILRLLADNVFNAGLDHVRFETTKSSGVALKDANGNNVGRATYRG